MTFNRIYKTDEVINGLGNSDFNKDSVIQIKSLFHPLFCEKIFNYIIENEEDIINKQSHDNKGLVLDIVNEKKMIKYFEYPFSYNRSLFGKFSQSKIYKIAESLLNSSVYLFSMEIHSRIAEGTAIPPHQDNAYYGLKEGKALTIYVPLNSQTYLKGGLRYLSNKVETQLDHKLSNEKGFSLTIDDNFSSSSYLKLDPTYQSGDCTIHHSRSIHYANSVPSNVDRGLVLRMSFFATTDSPNPDHAEWYKGIVEKNRSNNLFN